MSSKTKDPVEKQDPNSESGESHSDGEVEKAEENLEHLNIEPKEEAKDDTDESMSSDFPIQEGPPSSPEYRHSEPAGSSGHGDPRLTHSEPAFQDFKKGCQELLDSTAAPEPKEEAKDDTDVSMSSDFPIQEGPPSSPEYRHSESTGSSGLGDPRLTRSEPPYRDTKGHREMLDSTSAPPDLAIIQSLEDKPASAVPSKRYFEPKKRDLPHHYYEGLPSHLQTLAYKRVAFACGGRSTSSDISEIRSEVVDLPPEDHKASDDVVKETSPSDDVPAVERQSSEVQRKQDCGGLIQQEQKESNTAEHVARKMEAEEKAETSNVQEASPSVGRKRVSDSDSEEIVAAKLRPRVKPDVLRKSKIAASKSGATSQSSSDSPDPKSSSSDELRSKDSPDIESSSPSQSDGGKKSWQKFGQLRSMQLSAVTSKDSVITEEEEGQLSPRRALNPELMETSREKMKATREKNVEGATGTKQTELKSSLESGDQACASHAVATSKEHESSFEVSEFERSVGPTKRPGGKLSTSPPSDETLSSTPPKEATSRPKKKKARADKKNEKTTRRTRHDSGGSVPGSVSRERLQRDDSASTSTPDVSDYSGSDKDEEKTAF